MSDALSFDNCKKVADSLMEKATKVAKVTTLAEAGMYLKWMTMHG